MKKTVCELFAGVGGFRCGLNNIRTAEDYGKEEKWDTVWFSQWEPAEKSTQYAHDCYVYRFGTRLDNNIPRIIRLKMWIRQLFLTSICLTVDSRVRTIL